MNLKTYLQNRRAMRPNNLIELSDEALERFKNQAAVLPEPIKIGDVLYPQGIEWGGTSLSSGNTALAAFTVIVSVNGTDEDAEMNRVSYTQFTRRQQNNGKTPLDVPINAKIKEEFPEEQFELRDVYKVAKNMTVGEFSDYLQKDGVRFVLAGRDQVKAVYAGVETTVNIDRYCFIEEKTQSEDAPEKAEEKTEAEDAQ